MTDSPAGDLTILIAARNEARTIGSIVSRCLRYSSDILVVDGHSTDRTPDVAREHGARVIAQRELGKGDAIRLAIPSIERPITLLIDADGSHDPDDIPAVVEPIRRGDADHVSASRLIGGSSELHGGFDEFFRLAGNAFITACINTRFGVRISDSQNGFRAIRTEVLKRLDLRERLTTIEQEMIMKSLKRGYRLAEMPSHEHARRYGQSHVRVWRVWPRYVYVLVRDLF